MRRSRAVATLGDRLPAGTNDRRRRRVIGNQPWTSIGSTKNPTWNPQAVFHFGACENSTVEAKLCVKDPNGTTCKSTFLAVHKGPC